MRSWYLLFLVVFINMSVFAQTFSENFDVSRLNPPQPWQLEGRAKKYNVLSTDFRLSGNKSFKSHLPIQVYSNARAELRFNGGSNVPKHQSYNTTWGHKVAVYVPKNFKPDVNEEIIIQWHGMPDANDTYKAPPVAILLDGYNITFKLRYYKGSPSTKNNQVNKEFAAGRVTPGQWHYFVIDTHWDHRTNGKGFVKVYMKKGSQPSKSDILLNYNGPIASNDERGPYFKVGVYKPMWKLSDAIAKSRKAGVKERLLYYDNVTVRKGGFMNGTGTGSGSAPTVSISGPSSIKLPTRNANLTADASASGASISSYRWSKTSGPSASLSGVRSKTLKVTSMVKGTYTFKVVVTDSKGRKTSQNATLRVTDNNTGSTSPTQSSFTVNAGKDFSVLVSKKSFEMTPSWSKDYKVNRLRWKKISGPSGNGGYTGYGYKVTGIKVGKYVYEVWAEDSKGRTDTDRISVTVRSGSSIDSDIALSVTTVKNFTTKTDSVKLLTETNEGLNVHLKNVNGVELYIKNFNGELNTEAIRHGMYQYDVVDGEGVILQKGTLLIY